MRVAVVPPRAPRVDSYDAEGGEHLLTATVPKQLPLPENREGADEETDESSRRRREEEEEEEEEEGRRSSAERAAARASAAAARLGIPAGLSATEAAHAMVIAGQHAAPQILARTPLSVAVELGALRSEQDEGATGQEEAEKEETEEGALIEEQELKLDWPLVFSADMQTARDELNATAAIARYALDTRDLGYTSMVLKAQPTEQQHQRTLMLAEAERNLAADWASTYLRRQSAQFGSVVARENQFFRELQALSKSGWILSGLAGSAASQAVEGATSAAARTRVFVDYGESVAVAGTGSLFTVVNDSRGEPVDVASIMNIAGSTDPVRQSRRYLHLTAVNVCAEALPSPSGHVRLQFPSHYFHCEIVVSLRLRSGEEAKRVLSLNRSGARVLPEEPNIISHESALHYLLCRAQCSASARKLFAKLYYEALNASESDQKDFPHSWRVKARPAVLGQSKRSEDNVEVLADDRFIFSVNLRRIALDESILQPGSADHQPTSVAWLDALCALFAGTLEAIYDQELHAVYPAADVAQAQRRSKDWSLSVLHRSVGAAMHSNFVRSVRCGIQHALGDAPGFDMQLRSCASPNISSLETRLTIRRDAEGEPFLFCVGGSPPTVSSIICADKVASPSMAVSLIVRFFRSSILQAVARRQHQASGDAPTWLLNFDRAVDGLLLRSGDSPRILLSLVREGLRVQSETRDGEAETGSTDFVASWTDMRTMAEGENLVAADVLQAFISRLASSREEVLSAIQQVTTEADEGIAFVSRKRAIENESPAFEDSEALNEEASRPTKKRR